MYNYILTEAITTIKWAFLRDNKYIFVLILSGHTNLFHDLKQYHSLENAETKKYIFKLRYNFFEEKWLEKYLSCSDHKE